jgi:hypothetical protein
VNVQPTGARNAPSSAFPRLRKCSREKEPRHPVPVAHSGSPSGWRPFLLTLVLLTAAAAAAQPSPTANAPVSLHASVDHTEITIGDKIRYTVEVSAAADAEVLIPVLSGQLGDFTVSDFGDVPTRKDNGRVVVTRWYTITSFTTGDHSVPAPRVQFRRPGEALQTVEGNEVQVAVTSLLARDQGAADIRDIKPPEEVPFDWRPYGVAAAAVVFVGLLGAAFFYLLNRPRRQRLTPPRPAHEIALAALNRLRTQHLIEAGKFEDYYIELSAIIRRYLEDRFHLRAPEMTTEEFLGTAPTDARLTATQRRLLGDFLTQADLVKFARHLPSLTDSEAAYEAARRFVEETQPIATAPEVQHAAA